MPHYLFEASYTPAAIKALVNQPQDRETAVRPMIEAAGGKLHYMFFCFGKSDVIALIEAPDDETMASCALTVGASGTLSSGATTKLMTTKDAMKAMKKAQALAAKFKPVVAA